MSLAEQTRGVVEQTLRAFLDRRLSELSDGHPSLAAITTGVRDLVLRGGKRLRPIVAVTGYVAAGGGHSEDAARVASGLELLQAYLLVHDDWMDGDATRRGGPTLHVALAERWGSRLGDAAAVLAGDLCSSLARELLLGDAIESAGCFEAGALLAAQRAYAAFETDVVTGQMLDLLGPGDGRVAVEDLEDLKTGSYTVRGPLRLGAALAGAPPELQERLAAFGRPLGLAFQIRDDLLGLFGDPGRTGKGIGRDLRAGKRTWPVDWALRNAPPGEVESLQGVLGRADAPDAEVERAIVWLRDAGPRAAAEARIAALAAEARALRSGLPVEPDGARALDDLVGWLAEREA